MRSVTTQSGQARQDLIAFLTEAKRIATTERAEANRLRSLVRTVAAGQVDEHGDGVRIEISRETWDELRESAGDQP